MEELGVNNPLIGVASIGLGDCGHASYYNSLRANLRRSHSPQGKPSLTADGRALRRVPASHTGRSAKDKFIVRDSHTDGEIWWDNQQAMSHEHFGLLHKDMTGAPAAGKTSLARTSLADADADNALPTRVVTELAWHSLFIRNLLIRPDRSTLDEFRPKLTIINLPTFRADPARHGCRSETVIACDYTNGIVLFGGTSYAGGDQEVVFTALN